MYNQNKVVTAGADGFTVYYVDTKRHFNYIYHQPLLPYLQKLQVFGDAYKGKHYQQFEQDDFSPFQNRLYKDAVYGLNSYTLEQLKSMSIGEKLQIKRLNKLAQQILNQWKQEIVSRLVDDFLTTVFYKSKWVKLLVQYTGDFTSNHEVNSLGFAELNISKKDIALKLVEQKLLPDNFFKAVA